MERGTQKKGLYLLLRQVKLGLAVSQPNPPLPYSSLPVSVETMVSAPVPLFHQHTADSERFGFYVPSSQPPPIVPPDAALPDLQAINNPYVAAARKRAADSQLSIPQSCPEDAAMDAPDYVSTPLSHLAAHRPLSRQLSMLVIPEFLDDNLSRSEPLYSNPGILRQAGTVRGHQINPVLLPSSQVHHLDRLPALQSKGRTLARPLSQLTPIWKMEMVQDTLGMTRMKMKMRSKGGVRQISGRLLIQVCLPGEKSAN
jgi:hypothetical protein